MARTVLQKAHGNLIHALHTNRDGLFKPFQETADKYCGLLENMKSDFFMAIVNALYNIDGFEVRLDKEEMKKFDPILDFTEERDILVNRIYIRYINYNDFSETEIRISGIDEWCLGDRRKDGKHKDFMVITKNTSARTLHDLYWLLYSYLRKADMEEKKRMNPYNL